MFIGASDLGAKTNSAFVNAQRIRDVNFQRLLQVASEDTQPPKALLSLADALNNIPLDESPGETFHRDTHHDANVGPHSSAMHMVHHARFTYAFKRVQQFCFEYDHLGKTIVRCHVSLTGSLDYIFAIRLACSADHLGLRKNSVFLYAASSNSISLKVFLEFATACFC